MSTDQLKSPIKKFTMLLVLLAFLPLFIWGIKKIQDWRKAAVGQPANIFVDTNSIGSQISNDLWQNFAQGGEEAKNSLGPVVNEITALSPKLIRIDHLFDHHVKINGDGYDFSQLDEIIGTILQTGAKPMLSLSYMPPQLSEDGNNTSLPKDWNQWRKLVTATASRYSGRSGFNIEGIYYEVWNEPDLFGNWHYAKKKNYLTLYQETVSALQSANDLNSFKVGGPAITGFYTNWIKALLDFCRQNKARIDFISWHRYTKEISDYHQDFEQLNQILTDYPEYFTIERLITEFGPDSENSSWYDQKIGAIHTMATIANLIGKVHKVFSFELKDGPDPKGQQFWGRWGLLTHESQGIVKKPRYFTYQFLNQITGSRLALEGEGSWVSAIASKNEFLTQVLLINYDPKEIHYETVPVTLKNLLPGDYQIKTSYFLEKNSSTKERLSETTMTRQVLLTPNSAVLLEIERLGP